MVVSWCRCKRCRAHPAEVRRLRKVSERMSFDPVETRVNWVHNALGNMLELQGVRQQGAAGMMLRVGSMVYFTEKVGGVKWPGKWKRPFGCNKAMVDHAGERASLQNPETGWMRFQACGCRGYASPLGIYTWPPAGIEGWCRQVRHGFHVSKVKPCDCDDGTCFCSGDVGGHVCRDCGGTGLNPKLPPDSPCGYKESANRCACGRKRSDCTEAH